jgi:hypothetical protein
LGILTVPRNHRGDSKNARQLVQTQHEPYDEVVALGVLHAHFVLNHKPVRGHGAGKATERLDAEAKLGAAFFPQPAGDAHTPVAARVVR